MSAAEVDRLLGEWEERLRRVDENLLALESDPTYQMLAPRTQGVETIDGETARVVKPALAAMRELFEHRGRLTDVLERAREVRATMSPLAFWSNDEKEREVQALLSGPSIELSSQSTPLSERALLGPGERETRVVPEQLLGAMAQAFENARDAVVAVQRAWEASEPRLASMTRSAEDLRATAESLGLEGSECDELTAIERELEAVRVRLARDPLGAQRGMAEAIERRMTALGGRLHALAAVRTRVADGLVGARSLLAEVRAMRSRAVEAVHRLPGEVEGATASGQPTDAGLVEGLEPWLDKIEAAAAAGRWQTADVGLQKWTEAARGYLDGDGRIAGALERVVARREELAGRLSARRAQVAALAARGSEAPPGVEDVAREAERLLALRPTPLARAKALVERFEALIRR